MHPPSIFNHMLQRIHSVPVTSALHSFVFKNVTFFSPSGLSSPSGKSHIHPIVFPVRAQTILSYQDSKPSLYGTVFLKLFKSFFKTKKVLFLNKILCCSPIHKIDKRRGTLIEMGCRAWSAAHLAFPYLLSHMVAPEHLCKSPDALWNTI